MKTMNSVEIFIEDRIEFIDMHGYEYYDHIYGYTPVYGKRVIRRHKIYSTGNDIPSLLESYNEYYTDEEINNDDEHKKMNTLTNIR